MLFKDKYMYLGLFVTICLSFSIFYAAFYFEVWQPHNLHTVSDLPFHVIMLKKFQEAGYFPIYSLWYILVNLVSGFSTNYNNLAYTSIFLLIFFTSLKYIITYSLLKVNNTRTVASFLIALALLITMPILTYYTKEYSPHQIFVTNFHIYLGNIAPNQWHNSTLIFAMPFNLLLFYYSVKHIHSNKARDFFIISFLCIISIACKPNYAMGFIPMFCLYLFVSNFKTKPILSTMVKILLIAIPSALVLLLQWYFTFVHNDLFIHPQKTIIAPFLVWRCFSPHIFISLILSIAFPLSILIFYLRKMNTYLIVSWLVFIFLLLVFSLLAEYPVYTNGNYMWGLIAANYILFLFSAKTLLEQPFDWKAKIAFTVFGLHVLSGIFFLGYFFVYQSLLYF